MLSDLGGPGRSRCWSRHRARRARPHPEPHHPLGPRPPSERGDRAGLRPCRGAVRVGRGQSVTNRSSTARIDLYVTDYPVSPSARAALLGLRAALLLVEAPLLGAGGWAWWGGAGAAGRRPPRSGASAIRSRAARRLASWARCSHAATVTTPSTSRPSSRASIRARVVSGSDGERATSKESSTRESAVFTPWPPGPDERENRSRQLPARGRRPPADPQAVRVHRGSPGSGAHASDGRVDHHEVVAARDLGQLRRRTGGPGRRDVAADWLTGTTSSSSAVDAVHRDVEREPAGAGRAASSSGPGRVAQEAPDRAAAEALVVRRPEVERRRPARRHR